MAKKRQAKKENNKLSVLARSSKAIVDDYYRQEAKPKGAVPPLTDMTKVRDAVFQDDEIRGFIGSKVDSITASGYSYFGSDSAIKNAWKRDKEIRLRKHLKKIYQYCFSYQHIFVELIPTEATKSKAPKDRKIADLYNWSPIKVKPRQDKYGKILGFVKNQEGYEPDDVDWTNDEMVHISIDDITDSFWTIPQIITLYQLIQLKADVWAHIEFLYATNQFRNHFHAKNLDVTDVDAFTTMLKEGMKNPEKFLVTIGSEEMSGKQLASPSDLLPHIELLNKIRNNMLTVMRVPPIIAGTVDNSNRSNSEIQARFSFTNTMRAAQNDIEDELNFQLLPKLGMQNAELKHNSIDIKNDSEHMLIGQQLINSGASKSKTVAWLNTKGLDLPKDIYELTPEEKEQQMEEGTPNPEQNSKLFESRKPQDNFGK